MEQINNQTSTTCVSLLWGRTAEAGIPVEYGRNGRGTQHNLQLELGRVGRLERLVLQLLRLRRLCDQLAL